MTPAIDRSGPQIDEKLNHLLVQAGLAPLQPVLGDSFAAYLALILRWNARLNLTAIRDEDGILERHFVECIACARAIPAEVHTLLDFGSGAGFPGIPIALCRPGMTVTLAESQGKKAAFLQEAARTLGLRIQIHSGRAEALTAPFDCVTLRAVDKMDQAIPAAVALVRPEGWLVPMTTETDLARIRRLAGSEFVWAESLPLPGGEQRIVALGQRQCST